jgi:hypothetical protein
MPCCALPASADRQMAAGDLALIDMGCEYYQVT